MEDKLEDKLRSVFFAVETKQELAKVLNVKYKDLIYNLHKLTDDKKYIEFRIKKRGKGDRLIIAPNSGIKHIQRNLSEILLEIYPEKNCVHGYVKGKGIRSNALIHIKKKIVINMDLEEFFPSINFGRVRGVFRSKPFNFNDMISTTLAQICCYKGILPQGAPTSPIISNFICRSLDNAMLNLARRGKFNYTRYADDITFSTNMLPIPKGIGNISNNTLLLSAELEEIINSNGFKINTSKTRFAYSINRQEVTGLIVNKFPNVKRNYVRHVRAMLHALEKYEVSNAAREHFEKYNYKHKKELNIEVSYIYELAGKIGYIGMIKGKGDPVYIKMSERIKRLYPNIRLPIIQRESDLSKYPIIYTEGKTDWKHLKAALEYFKLKGEFLELEITFRKYEDHVKINNTDLMSICESLTKLEHRKSKAICLFDRDDKAIREKASVNGTNFKYWGNNVYSAVLPMPKHRSFEEICIEHYYTDEDIQIEDKHGRRLFLSSEFDKETAKHLTADLVYPSKNFLQAKYPRIIDFVNDPNTGKNRALSKNSFADYILNKDTLFKNVSFENFRVIFDLFQEIIRHSSN